MDIDPQYARQETLFELPAMKERATRGPGRPRILGVGNNRNRYRHARAEYYREQDRMRSARSYAARASWLRRVKETAGCGVCGERFHASLDFHHRNPSEKSFVISSNVARRNESLFAEMRKCLLLCKNCHHKVEHGALDVTGYPAFEPLAVLAELEAR